MSVPRREGNRSKFTSPDGISLLKKISGNGTPEGKEAGKGTTPDGKQGVTVIKKKPKYTGGKSHKEEPGAKPTAYSYKEKDSGPKPKSPHLNIDIKTAWDKKKSPGATPQKPKEEPDYNGKGKN